MNATGPAESWKFGMQSTASVGLDRPHPHSDMWRMIDALEIQLRGFIHDDLSHMGFTPDEIMAVPGTVDAMLPQYILGELNANTARMEAYKIVLRSGIASDYRAKLQSDARRLEGRIKDLQALGRIWP